MSKVNNNIVELVDLSNDNDDTACSSNASDLLFKFPGNDDFSNKAYDMLQARFAKTRSYKPSLVGKSRQDCNTIAVYKTDLRQLDVKRFLNDTLIDFWLKM